MNTNRHSYPPGYGASGGRQNVFSANHPTRKIPYWNPQMRGEECNPLGTSTPRKRVNVACARCRKRKIRCSGDPGDTTGCQNCKVAGVAQGQCMFLRVQCEQLVVGDQQNPSGHYDRFGAPIYVGTLATQYACLSAPAMVNGDASFENQLQIQRAMADPQFATPSLHPSRSMPNITRRTSHQESPHQNMPHPQSPEESGLALLARNAEAVSSLPCPAVTTYTLATSAAIETLAAVAAPSYMHWGPSPAVEGLRPSANSNSVNLQGRSDDIETTKGYTVPNGLSAPLYFDTTYTPAPTPQVASSMGLIPTSNVRASSLSGGYGYNHLASIASGVGHMTLALPNGKRAPTTSQSLPSEKCEIATTHASFPYTIGFADQSEGTPYSSRFSRVGGEISSPVDAYSVSGSSSGVKFRSHSDLDVISSPKPMADMRDSRHTPNSLDKVHSNLAVMTKAMRSGSSLNSPQEHIPQKTSSTHIIERQDLMSPPALPVSRPIPVQASMIRTSTNRPSSAGCGSSMGSPKYSYEAINYGDSAFARSMKASH
ncbi:hypothetical protein TWF281_001966 [Arthrobotrys megalospora]